MLCVSLRPSQSDISMIRGLEALNYINIRPNLFCIELPKPPIKTQLPIFQLFHSVNLRNDTGDCLWIANDWRLVPTLRHLERVGVRGPKYQWVDCPGYLSIHDRPNFLRILEAYRSEFPIIAGAAKYKEDLEGLGCIVTNLIDGYDPQQINNFIDGVINESNN